MLRRLVTLLPTIKPLVAVPACWRFLRVIPLAVVCSASETCAHFSCQSFCFVSLIWCNAISGGSVVLKFVRNCLLRSVEFDKSGFGRMTILLCYQVRKRTSLSFFLCHPFELSGRFQSHTVVNVFMWILWNSYVSFFQNVHCWSKAFMNDSTNLPFSYIGMGSPGTTLEGYWVKHILMCVLWVWSVWAGIPCWLLEGAWAGKPHSKFECSTKQSLNTNAAVPCEC